MTQGNESKLSWSISSSVRAMAKVGICVLPAYHASYVQLYVLFVGNKLPQG